MNVLLMLFRWPNRIEPAIRYTSQTVTRRRGAEVVAGGKRRFEEATPSAYRRPTPRTQEMRRT
jgi:hypothetical protein